MKRYLFLTLGSLFLALGIIGIILPLLPTTPFLLLSAACYMRSSPKLFQWLTNHKTFGPLINDYLTHRALSRRTKVTAITMLWIFIGFSLFIANHNWVIITFLISIALGVTLYLLSLKTKP